ncbi:MAG: DCC1-like thiol-disulfide oxidoreductase family protein [Gammaproteobacteria bacterium]|nr:DCC1-like thiol-disulfide oxidoreductase family protein [Gammaproteobacteria bacterium]
MTRSVASAYTGTLRSRSGMDNTASTRSGARPLLTSKASIRSSDHKLWSGAPLAEASLHLQTGAGEWLTGIDALIQAWSHTAWGWLFSTLRWPLLQPLARTSYQWYSQRRYQRLYGCPECTDPEEDR